MSNFKKETISIGVFRISETIILCTAFFIVLIKVYSSFSDNLSPPFEPTYVTIIQIICLLLLLALYVWQKRQVIIHKEREKQIVAEKIKAEESNRMKSAFLANMSHEIRTPLNAVVGFSSILAETSSEYKEYIHFIEQNNSLLLQIIDDILDLSKIEAGVLDFEYTTFDLKELMDEIGNIIRYKTSNNKVALKLEIPTDSYIIKADKKRVTQVLTNLLTNAFKFTNEGSVTYGYKFPQKDSIYFFVTDTGSGIPEESLGEIFDRFTRLDPSIRGTGLGLSICKLIVEKMGGSIGVESCLEKGSTFWFILPVKSESIK